MHGSMRDEQEVDWGLDLASQVGYFLYDQKLFDEALNWGRHGSNFIGSVT